MCMLGWSILNFVVMFKLGMIDIELCGPVFVGLVRH